MNGPFVKTARFSPPRGSDPGGLAMTQPPSSGLVAGQRRPQMAAAPPDQHFRRLDVDAPRQQRRDLELAVGELSRRFIRQLLAGFSLS
jgi:hypothetical protein